MSDASLSNETALGRASTHQTPPLRLVKQMIRTYGLYWKADNVDWGKKGPGGLGRLLGSAARGDTMSKVDFRHQRGIYALYSDFDLIYVGQTGQGDNRLLQRLRTHLSDHLAERWDRFSWFGMRWVTRANRLSADAMAANTSTGTALSVLEAVVIAVSEPRLNLRRGNWSDANAQQYFQIDFRE